VQRGFLTRPLDACDLFGRVTRNSPGNKRVSRLFPSTTDGVKRRPLLGSNPVSAESKTLSGFAAEGLSAMHWNIATRIDRLIARGV